MGSLVSFSQQGIGISNPVAFASGGAGGQLINTPATVSPALQSAVSGTATYNIEMTLDEVPNNVDGTWYPFQQNGVILGSALTAGVYYGIGAIVTAFRLNVTAGTGTVTLTLAVPYP